MIPAYSVPTESETGVQRLTIARYRDTHFALQEDDVASEVPVCLSYNGISHAVMLATPDKLRDFAVGFSITEGIVDGASEIYDVETWQRPEGIEVALEISSRAFAGLKYTRRAMHGRSGCGLCGKESLKQLAPAAARVDGDFAINTSALHRAMRGLGGAQTLNHSTGAVHAAAWCDLQGNVICVREDIGRHNALDKLAGAFAAEGFDPHKGFAVMTSRISYELVVKSCAMGISLLAAISAPTAYAVDLATRAGQTLAGFVRRDNCVVYSHPQRLVGL
ncbi:MAG: formate dehydrogenase accessory sulfurtransferase FdhD [Pseudomonadota bacterium]